MSESMLGHVNHCVYSYEIWSILEKLFHTQSKARLLQLRFMLQCTNKGSLSIEEYILKMQGIDNNLSAAGQAISDEVLILYILGGIGSEYESVVVNLTSRSEPLTLQDVQFMLQTHDMRIEQQLSSLNLNSSSISSSTSPSAHYVNNRMGQNNNSSNQYSRHAN